MFVVIVKAEIMKGYQNKCSRAPPTALPARSPPDPPLCQTYEVVKNIMLGYEPGQTLEFLGGSPVRSPTDPRKGFNLIHHHHHEFPMYYTHM